MDYPVHRSQVKHYEWFEVARVVGCIDGEVDSAKKIV
jgi:hypothetical protein